MYRMISVPSIAIDTGCRRRNNLNYGKVGSPDVKCASARASMRLVSQAHGGIGVSPIWPRCVLQRMAGSPAQGAARVWFLGNSAAASAYTYEAPEFPYKQPAWQNWREALFPVTLGLAAVSPPSRAVTHRAKKRK